MEGRKCYVMDENNKATVTGIFRGLSTASHSHGPGFGTVAIIEDELTGDLLEEPVIRVMMDNGTQANGDLVVEQNIRAILERHNLADQHDALTAYYRGQDQQSAWFDALVDISDNVLWWPVAFEDIAGDGHIWIDGRNWDFPTLVSQMENDEEHLETIDAHLPWFLMTWAPALLEIAALFGMYEQPVESGEEVVS